MVIAVVGCGRAGRPDNDQQHCYHHAPTVKLEAATAVVELVMMGMRTLETCWVVHKRQVINLRNCCIQLVDLFELSSQAVHDILPYLNAPWNTSYVLSSTKQDKVRKAKKDTTHKHTLIPIK
jgi:hypothetical protein